MDPTEPNQTEQSLEIALVRRTRTIADDPAAAQRKRDRESGRQYAQQYALEMLAMSVQIARDMSNDTKDRQRAIEYVCNRAWGTPKAEQSEDPAIANKTMLDILANISRECFEVEEATRKQIATQPRLSEPAGHVIVDAPFEELVHEENRSDC
jgi:hypothetical protein